MSDNKPLTEQKSLLVSQHLITSAVRFLGSLSVKGTPLQSQIEFLRKKGLNPIEIKSALERAKVNASSSHSDRTIWIAISYWLFPEKLGNGPLGFLLKLTRLSLTIALLVYFCYKAVEIVFLLFPQLRPLAKRLLVRVRRFLAFNKGNVPETETETQHTEELILDSFKELQEQSGAYMEDSLSCQMQDIEEIKQKVEQMRSKQESNVKELRCEIKSVRSLLLSTSQFPQPQSPPPDSQAPPPGLDSSVDFAPTGMFHRRSLNAASPQLTSLDSIFDSVDSSTENSKLKGDGTPEFPNPVPETQSEITESVEITVVDDTAL